MLNNLARCSDELDASHARCAQRYPDFAVPLTEFQGAVANTAAKYLIQLPERSTAPAEKELRHFIGELQAEDLYLALACTRGDESAWWEFDRQHRSFIERWTRKLMRIDTGADEVIDAVYVELFGTKVVGGVRQSKLRTYSGRGSLRGWLRTIVLHAVIDMCRAPKVEVAMEDCAPSEDELPVWQPADRSVEETMLTNVVRERYRAAAMAALDQALAALDDHETLLLLYYHVEGLKLREIARIVEEPRSPIRRWFQRRSSKSSRVHESTIMRWLEKVYSKISDRFHRELAHKHGLKPEEIAICRTIAAEDPGQAFDLTGMVNTLKPKSEAGNAPS